MSRTVMMTAPVGTDPLDSEKWEQVTGLIIDHPFIIAAAVHRG